MLAALPTQRGHPNHPIRLNSALKYPSKAAIIQTPWIYQLSIGFCLYYPMLPILCLPVSYLVCLSAYNLSISCVYENIQDYKNLLQFWFLIISRHKPYYPFKSSLSLDRYTGQVGSVVPFPFCPPCVPIIIHTMAWNPGVFPGPLLFLFYPKVWHPQVCCQ